MSVTRLILRYFQARLLLNLLTSLAVAIGVALVIAVTAMSAATKTSVLQTAGGFQLLVAAPGSPLQSVLSTLFFLEPPAGNVPLDLYRQLREDPGVERVVPLNLGDSYAGHFIVGTTQDYFSMLADTVGRPVGTEPEGRLFVEPFEAVLGFRAAELTGLRVGDSFVGIHGFIDVPEDLAHAHEQHPYTVVAFLERTNTPSDHAIFTSVETVWLIHDQHAPADLEHPVARAAHREAGDDHRLAAHDDGHEAQAPLRDGEAAPDHRGEELSADLAERDHGHGDAEQVANELTALFIKGESYADLLRLSRAIDAMPTAQAILPGRVVAQLFQYLDIGEAVVLALSWLAILVAFVAIMVSMLAATIERMREVATMRALGARRRTVVLTLLGETALIGLLGAIAGLAVGRAAAHILAVLVERTSGLVVQIAAIAIQDLGVIGVGLLLALLAGLVPAYAAYRQDVASRLSPSL